MLSEIITIGDEILIGQVIDSNSAWMAESLNSIGIQVGRITSIADQPGEIRMALDQAAGRFPIVLLTGGLGPTRDDVTKTALAEYFGSRLVLNRDALEQIEKLLASRGVRMNEMNRQQAMLPVNCRLIPNGYGTASGMWFERDGCQFIAMPGVPYEMKAMMTVFVLPGLKKIFDLPAVVHVTILTQGSPESHLAQKLEQFEDQLSEDVKLSYLPSPGMVRLRLSGTGPDRNRLLARLQEAACQIKKIIPEYVVSSESDKMEQIIGNLLLQKKASLSTAESCTGGYIARLISSVPGASGYFTGSVVAYSNEIKTRILGVDTMLVDRYGAVSEQVVLQMAEKARDLFRTDYSIATSGIAGPTGGTKEKPVGTTWIAVATAHGTTCERFIFSDERGRNIRKAALTALNMLRKSILQEK